MSASQAGSVSRGGSGRRLAREMILQALYQSDLAEQALETAALSLPVSDVPDENGGVRVDLDYVKSVTAGIQARLAELDHLIVETSEHWDLERVSVVERNILRLSLFELLERLDVPVKVVINEAVELSKRFGAENSGRFVNGILDRVAGRVRKVEVDHVRRRGSS